MLRSPKDRVIMSPSSLGSSSGGSSNGDPFYLEALLKKLPKQPPQQQESEPELAGNSVSSSEGDPNGDPFYLEALLKKLPKTPVTIGADNRGKDSSYPQKCDAQQASIMERTIETRALPNSFSANIGRRVREPGCPPPSRQASLVIDSSNNSKRRRDVEIWLEKTKEAVPSGKFETPNRALRTPSQRSIISTRTGHSKRAKDRGASKLYETPENKTFNAFPESPLLKTPTAPESYEQNLLDYKKFFNNRPLGRCMDDDQPEGEFFQRNPAVIEPNPTKNVLIDGTWHEQKNDVAKNSDPYINEEVEVYSDSNYSQEDKVKHDPQEAKKFWNNVRTQVWISDVELSSNEDEQIGEDVKEGGRVSHPTNRLSEPGRQEYGPDDNRWVMLWDPSKWSYTGSMAGGNIYLGEDCPEFPELLLSPRTPPGKDIEDKLKDLSEFFDRSEEKCTGKQRQTWQEYFEDGGYIHLRQNHDRMQESLTELDEFFATTPEQVPAGQRPENKTHKHYASALKSSKKKGDVQGMAGVAHGLHTSSLGARINTQVVKKTQKFTESPLKNRSVLERIENFLASHPNPLLVPQKPAAKDNEIPALSRESGAKTRNSDEKADESAATTSEKSGKAMIHGPLGEAKAMAKIKSSRKKMSRTHLRAFTL